jgi:hypothetical protein
MFPISFYSYECATSLGIPLRGFDRTDIVNGEGFCPRIR